MTKLQQYKIKNQAEKQSRLFYVEYVLIDSWVSEPTRRHMSITPNVLSWIEQKERAGIGVQITSCVASNNGEQLKCQ